MSCAFDCYSEESRIVIGDVDNFEDLVSGPPFDALVGHEDAQVLMTTNLDKHVASCFVKIIPNKKLKKWKKVPCLHYWWELSKRDGEDDVIDDDDDIDDEDYDEDNEACWMVDAFMPDFDDMDFEAVEVIEDDDFFDIEF